MEHQVQQVQQEVQAHLVQQEVQDHQVHLVQMVTLAVSHLNINGQQALFRSNSGKLKLNNSNFLNVTKLSIDILDQDGSTITDFLATIDDSTSTIKGHFKISKRGVPGDFLLFTIDALTQNSGFFEVDASLVSNSITSITNNTNLLITFARTGDAGISGSSGTSGSTGSSGTTGTSGSTGSAGSAGSQVQQVHLVQLDRLVLQEHLVLMV